METTRMGSYRGSHSEAVVGAGPSFVHDTGLAGLHQVHESANFVVVQVKTHGSHHLQ